jgi:hypothetical protein
LAGTDEEQVKWREPFFFDTSDAEADLQNSIRPGTTTDHLFQRKKQARDSEGIIRAAIRSLFMTKRSTFFDQIDEPRVL